MLTISAVAEHKEISLTGAEVRVSRISDTDQGTHTSFTVKIKLQHDLNNREKVLLLNAARKCDVSKILAGKVDFSYQLIED